jgi:hypothetical protein
MNINEFKLTIERIINARIESLSKDNAFFDPTKKRFELKPSKTSETIYLCGSSVMKIMSLKNNRRNIEISMHYKDLFKLQGRVQDKKNDTDWGVVSYDEQAAAAIIDNIDSVFMRCYSEEPVDSYGCCSRYEMCSDERKCVHPDVKFAQGCMYKKNLENGRIFYGKNRNVG